MDVHFNEIHSTFLTEGSECVQLSSTTDALAGKGDAVTLMEVLNPCTCVKKVLLHQSSKLTSSMYSSFRPLLIAASIFAASGSFFQQPQRLQNSFSFSSSDISVSNTSSLLTTEELSRATNSIFTGSLKSFSIFQYRRLMGECGVKTVPFKFAILHSRRPT